MKYRIGDTVIKKGLSGLFIITSTVYYQKETYYQIQQREAPNEIEEFVKESFLEYALPPEYYFYNRAPEEPGGIFDLSDMD